MLINMNIICMHVLIKYPVLLITIIYKNVFLCFNSDTKLLLFK